MALPLNPPFEPMLAKITRELPAGGEVLYEPKWDGFRCVVFRDGDDLDLQSRNQRPLLRYFPELREPMLGNARQPLFVTPATMSRDVAADWFKRFEGAGFDGVVAKPLTDTYHPGQRAMVKVKHERTCDCVVAGYRVHKDGNGVGSLLVGLYDDDGSLHHVGVASGMAAKLRTELQEDVEPLRA